MPYQILVVDDDTNIRELAALHLRAAGHSVRLAEDGVAGGYAVLESPPDLILCDLHMPRMTGLEFVAALRADTTIPRIPVLFLSSMDEGTEHAQQLGAVEYLLKPLRADLLLDAVSRHLPRRPASEPRLN
jgi:CheY-like chemotaxis protein